MIPVTAAGTTTFVRRYLDAQQAPDVDTLAACRHPDFEIHWPQTGEQVAGHDADLRIRTSAGTGNGLLSTPVPVFGHNHSSWQLTAGDGVCLGQTVGAFGDATPCHVVTVLELQAGLVRRETNWIAPSFPRPQSRTKLSEATDWRAARDVTELAVPEHIAAHRRRAIEVYFNCLREDPVGAHEAFLHPHAVEVMPQSSERITGRDRMLEVLLSHPNFPTVGLRRALVIGDSGLVEADVQEGDEAFFGIAIIHFRGSKADQITEYWAPRLDASPHRRRWTQRLERVQWSQPPPRPHSPG